MSLIYQLKYKIYQVIYSGFYVELINNYYIIVIGIVLFLFSLNDLFFIILFFGYVIWIYRRSFSLLYLLLIISFLILINFLIISTKPGLNTGNIQGTIDLIDTREYSSRLLVRTSKGKVYVYDYEFLNLDVGIKIKGEILEPSLIKIEGEFNYQNYLKQNNIIGSIKASTIEVIGKRYTVSWFIQKINEYFERSFSGNTLIFMKALLLGDDSGFDDKFKEALIVNGTFHLFAISGSHISLFVILLSKLLGYFFKNEKIIEFILCLFLLIYMIITNFSPSIVRATLMYYLLIINKRWKLRLSSMDIVSIVFLLLIIINPFYMYNMGFILSFLISFLIVLINPVIKDKTILIQSLIISFLAQIISLPITININHEVNILSPIINIISIFLVETIILPLTILTFFLPLSQMLYILMINGFMSINNFFKNYINISLRFPHFDTLAIVIFYGLLFILCSYRHKKITFVCFCCFLLCFSNKKIFQINGEVYYLDVYNGESIVIIQPFNKGNIVIDTGDGTNNAVGEFLKRKGIKIIDLLVVTHNHIDHNGETKSLINDFVINNIVINAYDKSELSNFSKVIKVSKGDKIYSGEIEFLVLNPKEKSLDENDNSIVLYGKIGGLKHLLIGDVSKKIEMEFSNLEVDVIKIAHHGSNTSTTPAFIKKLNPKYAVIQTGHMEKFGFPHSEVMDALDNVHKVFRTDVHGSIKFKYNKKHSIFKTLR
jgi:competence protein ComEC